jgi:rhamnose transport system substrate-binding protein
MKFSKLFISVFLVLIIMVTTLGCANNASPSQTATGTSKGKIAFVTFATGIPYFEVGAAGAEAAGKALGYDVVYKGPPQADSAGEIQIINDLVSQGDVKAIVATCMDSSSIVPALKKARAAGIKVVMWDLDCDKEGRDFYAGLMDLVLMGNEWIDSMVRTIGDRGEYAIVAATLTNQAMADRVENMKKYAAQKYPNLKLVSIEDCNADPQKAYQIATDLMTKYPDLKCICTSSTEAFSSGAKAIQDAGKIGKVFVAGGITPKEVKPAFESGAAKEAVLWDPGKWAGFAVTIAAQLVEGKLFTKTGPVSIPSYPKAELFSSDTFYYYELLTFTPQNVSQYNF